MEKTSVSKATLGRLPEYLKLLKELSLNEHPYISATAISKILNLGDVQVRKDLASVSGKGKPRVGYVTKTLIKRIEEFLGYNELTYAVLVGTGKLGRALLQFSEFAQYGVKIAAAFDCDKNVISHENNPEIMCMEEFDNYCKNHKIKIGIITVGKNSAQEICDKMVNAKLNAIWNFAPCKLTVPEGIIVKNENLALSLASLNIMLRK